MRLRPVRGWFTFIGPIFIYDLIRTARRSSYLVVRWGFLLAIFGILALTFVLWSISEPDVSLQKSSANFCSAFFGVYMFFNVLGVFLLTPAYAAGALAEEKEHQTLDALLASDLRDREIVLGTYLARITKLGMIFLAPMPIFSFLQFLGGVEPTLIVAGFVFTAISMCGLAALSLFFSVRAEKPREALIKTYMVTLLFVAVLTISWALIKSVPGWNIYPGTDKWVSPITAEDVIDWMNIGNPVVLWLEVVQGISFGSTLDKLLPGLLARYAAFHGLVILCVSIYATLYLRKYALEAGQESGLGHGGQVCIKAWLRSSWSRLPILANRPMLWKEFLVEPPLRRGWLRRGLLGLGVALLLLPLVHTAYFFRTDIFPGANPRARELISLWLRVLCALLGCVALLQTLATAAGSVTGEREKRTLEELLATPLTDRAIFFAKWQSSVFRFGSAWSGLAGLWCLGLALGCIHFTAIPVFILCWLSIAAFLASLGIWFSVVSQSTRRALAGAFFIFSALIGCAALASFNLADKYLPRQEAVGLFPAAMLAYVTFTPEEWTNWLDGKVQFRPGVYALALGFWGVAALGIFLAARSRFTTLTGRVEGDAVATAPTFDAIVTEPDMEPVPRPAWSRLIFRLLGGWSGGMVRLGVSILPGIILVGVYQIRAQRSANELRQYLERLDATESNWQVHIDREVAAAAQRDKQGVRALLSRIESLLPRKQPEADQEFETVLRKDIPDRELFSTTVMKSLQTSQHASLDALRESRKLWAAGYHEVPAPWKVETLEVFRLASALDRMLLCDALVEIQERRADQALTSAGSVIIMAAALGDMSDKLGPFRWLQRQFSTQTAIRITQRTLAQLEPSEAVLAKLQDLLEREDQPHVEKMLRAERARFYAGLVDRNREVSIDEWQMFYERPRAANGVPLIPSFEELFFLASSRSMEDQRGDVLRFLTECIKGSLNAAVPPSSWGRSRADLVSFQLRQVYMGCYYIACTRAQLRAAIVAVALERFRRRHGAWPSTLAELTPKYLKTIPVGTFDGKPLIYKRLKDGVIVYTVGADLVDRGGNLARQQWTMGFVDFGIRLYDPASRQGQTAAPSEPDSSRR